MLIMFDRGFVMSIKNKVEEIIYSSLYFSNYPETKILYFLIIITLTMHTMFFMTNETCSGLVLMFLS